MWIVQSHKELPTSDNLSLISSRVYMCRWHDIVYQQETDEKLAQSTRIRAAAAAAAGTTDEP